MWGKLCENAAQSALAKLDSVLPEEQLREVAWARRTLVASHLHREDQGPLEPILEKLRTASRERRSVRMFYQSRSRLKSRERELDPYALVHRWGWWYVVGQCHLREEVRTFRVDRILDLVVLGETFEAPPFFDVHGYMATDPRAQVQLTARLRFGPEAALVARDDRAFWDTIEQQADGSVVVTLGVPSLEWAARQVLFSGPQVSVIERYELAQLVAEQASAIVAVHAESGGRVGGAGE